MTGLIAGIGGQMLLPAGDPYGYRLFCLVANLICLALVPTSLSRATAPAHAVSDTKINLAQLYRQSPFGVVAAVLCGITTSSFFALGPIWAQERGLDTTEIAIFMACGTLGGFVTTYPLGWLSDRMDRRHVIIGASGMAAAILLALIHFVPSTVPVWLVFLYVAIFGGSVIPTYSIVTAHVNDMVKPGEFVAAAGGLLILQGIGATIGPVISGLAMTEFGRLGLLYIVITAQALMAIWGAYRSLQRAAPATEDKETFVPEPGDPVVRGVVALCAPPPGTASHTSSDCPPSIQTGVPVMWRARSEERKSTSSATSSLVPGSLPVSGIEPAGYSAGTSASRVCRLSVLSEISVSILPGQTTFTRILCLASSTASICAIATWAALVAE